MEKRTRYQNIILAILAVMTVAFGALLFYNRTQSGIQFREAFLKQTVTEENTLYSGKCKGKDIVITVAEFSEDTSVEIAAGEYSWSYIVSDWAGGKTDNHGGKAVEVTNGEGKLLFRGYAHVNILLDENGKLAADHMGIYITWGDQERDEWKDYDPSMLTVIKLATEPEIVHRGSIGLYFLMLLLTFLVALDVIVPNLFFQLRHMMSVRDPEPSNFYIAAQRLGWAVFPVLLAVGYGYAVMMIP